MKRLKLSIYGCSTNKTINFPPNHDYCILKILYLFFFQLATIKCQHNCFLVLFFFVLCTLLAQKVRRVVFSCFVFLRLVYPISAESQTCCVFLFCFSSSCVHYYCISAESQTCCVFLFFFFSSCVPLLAQKVRCAVFSCFAFLRLVYLILLY